MKARNQKVQREHNRRLILQLIRAHKLISRVSIARIIDLEKSSVSNIVNELLEFNILQETDQGAASSSGGRRPVLLEIKKDQACFLGFEIQPHLSRAVLVGLTGEIIHQWSKSHPESNELFSNLALSAFNEVFKRLGGLNKQVAGICVALPGRLDSRARKVHESVLFDMHESDLAFLDGINPWKLPVAIENDALACAWAQLGASYGPQDRIDNFFIVFAQMVQNQSLSPERSGLGVGTALVLDRQIHLGKTSAAGEFRSVFWKRGDRGQFAAPSFDPAVIGTDSPEFRAVLAELLATITPVLFALELERVYFCGEASAWFPLISSVLAEEMSGSALANYGSAHKLYPAPEPQYMAARGAALRFIEKLYYTPDPQGANSSPTWESIMGHRSKG